MNKSKLNELDVEQTITGQPIHIDMSDERIKDDVFLPYMETKEFKPMQPDPTLKEIKKEWEKTFNCKFDISNFKKYKFINVEFYYDKDKEDVEKTLYIDYGTKEYECYHGKEISSGIYGKGTYLMSESISFEIHQLLHKLFEILG